MAILAVSIPLFRVSLKAGKENDEAYRNAEKKTREAEYLHKVLTERESAEERTLFGYSDWLNKKWLEKSEKARKITMSVMLRKMCLSDRKYAVSFFVPSVRFPPVLPPFRITGKGQGNVFSFSVSVRRFPGWHPEVSSGSASVPGSTRKTGRSGRRQGV